MKKSAFRSWADVFKAFRHARDVGGRGSNGFAHSDGVGERWVRVRLIAGSRLPRQCAGEGFTTIVAVGFGPDKLLYALELSAGVGFPTPGLGKVVRVTKTGAIQDVATGLAVPTAMTFGPDGRLYVSNLGAAPAGAGQIVRIDIP